MDFQLPQQTKEAIRLYVDDYIQTQWMPLFTETVMPNSGMVPVLDSIPDHRWQRAAKIMWGLNHRYERGGIKDYENWPGWKNMHLMNYDQAFSHVTPLELAAAFARAGPNDRPRWSLWKEGSVYLVKKHK